MVQGDIDLLEFLTWVQHMSATPTAVTPNMVWYYKEQAARGNSAAILNLAVCHLSGVGMLKDSATGVALMREAASRGNPMAVRRTTVSAFRYGLPGGFILLYRRAYCCICICYVLSM